jgi:hypothetical protein
MAVAGLTLPSVRGAAQIAADDDFEPANREWNGLSALLSLADERDLPVEVVERIDIGTLGADDAVIIVGPREELPAGGLTDFMRAGGRVALADDFGEGDSLLRTFRIGRGRPGSRDALRLRGNDELLVARPVAIHPLTQGVGALVTNHPMIVYHQDLEPIFAFDPAPGGARDAVILAGAVGTGRLVAIADPSVLINNMLTLGGNRRFAENLLVYLAGERGGRILLVPPHAEIRGRFGEPGADRPLHDLRAALERLATAELPASAIRVAGAALAGILLVLAAGVLPRSSPYVSAAMFARPSVSGGFAGRVAWFAERPLNLGDPAMVYKQELELELRRLLDLGAAVSGARTGKIGIDDVGRGMKARGMSEAEIAAMRQLLGELSTLEDEMERGTRGDALPEARFRRLVRTGDALVDALRRKAVSA